MTDWSLLGGDPAPGDPELIERRCSHLKVAAQAVEEIDDALGRVALGTIDAGWAGQTAEAMRGTLDGLRGDLAPVAESFLVVGATMSWYADVLADLQAQARQALRRAVAAEQLRATSQQRRNDAGALLARQQAQLNADRAAQRGHAVTSTVQNVVDPSSAAANAAEARRLARAAQQSQAAVQDTQQEVHRLDVAINGALADLATAKRTAGSVRAEWDRSSRQSAASVRDALADQLRNRSALEKAIKWVTDEVGDILEFLQDPLHNLSVLRRWLDRIHEALSILATACTIAGVLLSWTPAGPILLAVGRGLAIAALVVSIAKFGLDLLLFHKGYTEDGRQVVRRSDLGSGALDIGFSALGVVGGGKAMKVPAETLTKGMAPKAAKPIIDAARKQALKEGMKEYGKAGIDITASELSDAIVTTKLDRDDARRYRPRYVAPIPRRCLANPARPGVVVGSAP